MIRLVLVICFLSFTFATAQKRSKSYINEKNYDGFVEPDFPFINSALDLGKSDKGFPANNYTPRGVFLKLGSGVWACFDRDLLRVSAIWSGGDFSLSTMSQISYPGSGKKSSSFPTIKGKLKFATGVYAGVSINGQFKDPRKTRLGEMPEGKWLGIDLQGGIPVLNYIINGIGIKEQISELDMGVFSRKIEISKPGSVSFALFQKSGLKSLTHKKGIYEIQDGSKTIFLIVKNGKLNLSDDGIVIFKPSGKLSEVCFSYEKKRFLNSLGRSSKIRLKNKRFWPQTVTTKVKYGAGEEAYVIDKIELPLKNPWRRSLRIAAVDFFKNGRAAAVTFDGDVWLIDGLKADMKSVKWRRFASGLYSPLSLKIHNEKIFVFGRDQITRLHDRNADGEADYYENYSTAFLQAMNTRDFSMDMVIDKDENIYLAKGGIQNMGGKLANKDFYHSKHAGSVIRIFNNGKSAEVFADGFREPFLGYNPIKNQLYATDQQGHYVPATPIMTVRSGGYYGHEPSNYRKAKNITEPLTWIPHRVDNSAAGMTFVGSDRMGPLSQRMTLQSYGKMASFMVYEGEGYGGVVRIPGDATFALLKGAMNPLDGQLYVTGFKIYSHTSPDLSGLARLRYTGKKVNFPTDIAVYKEGVELSFDEKFKKSDLQNIGNYVVQRWNYLRSSKYGSGHYRMNKSPGEESLVVSKAVVNENSDKVFLVIPGMSKVEQMAVEYRLPGKSSEVYFSVSKLRELAESHFAAKEAAALDLTAAVMKSKSNLKRSAELGEKLMTKYSCIACHSSDGSKIGKIGPTFKGLYGTKRNFVKAAPQKADEAYIRESLLEPGKKIVKGFQVAMGSYRGILNEVEIDSIILYLKTLK